MPNVELVSGITYAFLFIALYAEVFLLIAFLETRSEVRGGGVAISDEKLPSVAIIIPCWNEAETVAGTITSLLALDYPKGKLSILAVNDGSTDKTLQTLQSFKHYPQIQILTKENGGKYSAMNMALAHTTAEIIGCLDADSFVDPRALRASIAQFISTGASAVTPAIVAHAPSGILGLVQQAEYALSIFMRNAFAASESVFITPGPFSLFKRVVVEEMGGWRHAHGTEDMEIALRLQRAGHKIVNAPDAAVFTKTPTTYRKLYTQRVRWSYGFIMNMFDNRDMLFNRGFGTLGMIVLPTACISIVAAIYFTGLVLFQILQRVFLYTEKLQTVGVSFHTPSPEVFYVSTTATSIIIYAMIALVVVLILIGRTLSRVPIHPLSIPAYFLLYSLIAPWWLMGAVARATFRFEAPWR